MQFTRYSCQVLIKLKFSEQILKLMKIRPLGAELSDGRTFVSKKSLETEASSFFFRNLANAPKTALYYL
jgi:hypothetical protein